MAERGLVGQFIQFLFFALIQVLILKDLVLFNTGFCFFYIGFLLMLPLNMPKGLVLVSAFVFGWIIDIFYNSYGINAAACVLIVYLRPVLVKYFFSNMPGSDDLGNTTLKTLGFNGYTAYILLFAFIHHLVIFYGEAFSTNAFFYTFLKVVVSAFYTCFMIVASQYLFFYSKRDR